MFFHYYYYSFAVYDRVVVGYHSLFIIYCVVIGLISARLLGAGTATGKVCGARYGVQVLLDAVSPPAARHRGPDTEAAKAQGGMRGVCDVCNGCHGNRLPCPACVPGVRTDTPVLVQRVRRLFVPRDFLLYPYIPVYMR